MKLVLITISILMVILANAFAGEAFFRPLARQKVQLVEGDSFKGVIELWNIDNISPEMINSLVGTSFLDNFYVVSLSRPRWAESNPEIVLVEGLFVLQKRIEKKIKNWKLGGLNIQVTVKEFETTPFNSVQKGFVVLESDFDLSDPSYLKYIIPVAFLFILSLLLFFLRRRKKTTTVSIKEKDINWKEVFVKASNKEDFSFIYSTKDVWSTKLSDNENSSLEFITTAKQYLFKKEIEDFEIEELKVLIEPIAKEIR